MDRLYLNNIGHAVIKICIGNVKKFKSIFQNQSLDMFQNIETFVLFYNIWHQYITVSQDISQ